MNERFGLMVETDFYVQTELPSGRYLDFTDGRNMAIKINRGKTHQIWYFHQQSMTIRSRVNN
jgi:hypothetical protein